MTTPTSPSHEALERIFHEPSRLAIMSALCAAPDGLTFNDLKNACNLTDGNLSRHLTVLEGDGVVRIHKEFVGAKPRTTVFLAEAGLDRFTEYLAALEEVLQRAKRAQAALESKAKAAPAHSRHLRPAKA